MATLPDAEPDFSEIPELEEGYFKSAVKNPFHRPVKDKEHPQLSGKRYDGDMTTARYVHWQDSDMWLGSLEEFPDYLTHGETVAELEENLRDLYRDLTSGEEVDFAPDYGPYRGSA